MDDEHFVYGGIALLVIAIVSWAVWQSYAPVAAGEKAFTYASLLQELRAAGMEVESKGPMEQPFMREKGRLLSVNTEPVQVFEFSSAAGAAEFAATVSPAGTAIGTSLISWIVPPRFYMKDLVIVIFIGSSDSTVAALGRILGEPFASARAMEKHACTLDEKAADSCTEIFQPVCSQYADGSTETFSNGCFACVAGADFWIKGEC